MSNKIMDFFLFENGRFTDPRPKYLMPETEIELMTKLELSNNFPC